MAGLKVHVLIQIFSEDHLGRELYALWRIQGLHLILDVGFECWREENLVQ